MTRALLLLLPLVLAAAGPAFGDFWYEYYAEAEKALKAKDWTGAIEQLTLAIGKKGTPAARARSSGMRTVPYFPYLKLGIAYYELGQLDTALQAFETEEKLGAITEDIKEARGPYRELQDYRGRAGQAQQASAAATAAEETERIRKSVQQAQAFEENGQLDEAIEALAEGLAASSPEARAALQRLQNKIAQRQDESERRDRVERLVEQGQTLLDQNKFDEASRSFRQAVSLDPDNKRAESLLQEAQSRLRTQVAQQQDDAQNERVVSDGLHQARKLADAGNLQEALNQLERINAFDPGNREILVFQDQLLAARQSELDVEAADDAEKKRLGRIRNLLDEAKSELRSGSASKALTTANLVLALDRNNRAAQRYTTDAIQKINRELLGSDVNLPPAISFADFRRHLEDDGLQVQRTQNPDFQLSGVVYDTSNLIIVARDGSGTDIPSTRYEAIGDNVTQFSLSHQLSPGRSIIQLLVTDDGGLEAREEYVVIYVRPLHRSPWFYSAPSAVLLSALGFVAWRRAQERKRRRKRRFNPYIAGAPILDEDLFFGRDQLIDRILQTVHNNSLLLYGERRIGKTSLQHQVMNRLANLEDPTYDFYPVYIDLQGTPQERFFATLAEDVFTELAPLLDGLQPTVSDSAEYSHRDLVRDLRKVLQVLEKRSTRTVKLVLLMDEVDELNHYDPKVNQRLRGLFMKRFSRNLVTVVSGVAIKKKWESEGSPWYNFFEEIEVKPFREEDARVLIERPIRGLFKLEEGVVDRIISGTGCKPYLIQKFCVALVNHLYEVDRRTITLADVEVVGLPKEV